MACSSSIPAPGRRSGRPDRRSQRGLGRALPAGAAQVGTAHQRLPKWRWEDARHRRWWDCRVISHERHASLRCGTDHQVSRAGESSASRRIDWKDEPCPCAGRSSFWVPSAAVRRCARRWYTRGALTPVSLVNCPRADDLNPRGRWSTYLCGTCSPLWDLLAEIGEFATGATWWAADFPAKVMAKAGDRELARRAQALVERMAAPGRPWLWKDPALCHFLGFRPALSLRLTALMSSPSHPQSRHLDNQSPGVSLSALPA
jgi:hypothetical protein